MSSNDSRGKHGNHSRGAAHYRWNSRLRSSHGYIKLRVGKGHPLADPNGYAYEHLVVWVTAGNPPPTPSQVIHHRNEDKTDNRLGNLELLPRVEHSKTHHVCVSDELVREIRELYAAGRADMPTLARSHGIPISRISKFIRGESRVGAGGPTSTNNRRAAGRLLFGQEWSEFPEVRR